MALSRYMQHRGAKRDEGLPQPLTTVEVFLVVEEEEAEVRLVHQRSLQHSSLDSVTSVAAVSPNQLFAATSCNSHAASWWKIAMEAVTSLACCSSIWQLDIACGSEENCFDTHLGGDLTGVQRVNVFELLFCLILGLTLLAVSVVASGLRNIQSLALTADRQHLLAAESTARSLAVFRAHAVDGRLVPAAAITLAFSPSKLSLSHSRLLVAGQVQTLRTALLGRSRLPVDSSVAEVPAANAEQCSQEGAAFVARALLGMNAVYVTASLFATANVVVVGTESHGVRVCRSH